MGVLNKTIFTVIPAVLTVTALQCSFKAPTASVESALAVNISPVTTVTQPPSELVITIANEEGFQKSQVISPVPENGRTEFVQVPYGHLFIDITGRSQELRTLYGHSEADVQAPRASVLVELKNIIGVKNLDAAQEENFLQSGTIRSAFWDAVPKQSTALCTTAEGQTIVRATIASSARYLYFLFEVTDTLFFSGDRPATGIGELTSDAVIVYLSKVPPHELAPDNQSFPIVRFQCEMGRTIPEDGLFNFINFASPDVVRNGPLANFTTDEINARIIRVGINQRLLEVRIRKPLLALPEEVLKNSQLFGMVLRYRNSNSGTLPAVLSDWQSGTFEMNPRQVSGPWGYLEVNP